MSSCERGLNVDKWKGGGRAGGSNELLDGPGRGGRRGGRGGWVGGWVGQYLFTGAAQAFALLLVSHLPVGFLARVGAVGGAVAGRAAVGGGGWVG